MFALLIAFLILTNFEESATYTNPECNCGYGGLCARDPAGIIERLPCDQILPKISEGLYFGDNQIVNHCLSSPCLRGQCKTTFGGYFCDCPKDYFGQNCETMDQRLTALGVKQEVYVYYQVQPQPRRPKSFFVIYDSLEPPDFPPDKLHLQLVVNISDGRSYYPIRKKHLILRDVRSICLADSTKYPMLQDGRICNYLPEGDAWSFEFDPNYGGLLDSIEGRVSVDGLGPVGQSNSVSIFVHVVDSTFSLVMTLYNHSYKIFTYQYQRTPNNCLMEISFSGCSSNPNYPTVYARGVIVNIDVLRKNIRCRACLLLGHNWFLQEHTDMKEPYPEKDRVPEPLAFGSKSRLSFRPRFFQKGTHMIEYHPLLRGDPPIFGAIRQFRVPGRCWIKIITNEPQIMVKGGLVQSVSCFGTMRLKLFNYNPDHDIKTIRFQTSCNETDDVECKERFLEASTVTKVNPSCSSYLEIKVGSPLMNLEPIHINVHFVDVSSSFRLECLFNCFPINPQERVIVAAITKPYVSRSVDWTVTMEHESINERDGKITAFLPSSATRIIRMNGDRFDTLKRKASEVRFIAGNGDHYHAEIVTKSIHLGAHLHEFNLVKSSTRTGFYSYNRTSETDISTPPVVYSVQQRHAKLLVESTILETNYEDRLEFSPNWNSVKLCAIDANRFRACSDWTDVQGEGVGSLSIDDLKVSAHVGDDSAVLGNSLLLLVSGLDWSEESNQTVKLKWRLSVTERTKILQLAKKVNLNSAEDIMKAIQIVYLLAFSSLGNSVEEMDVGFMDEDFLKDVGHTSAWLRMGHTNLLFLKKIIQSLIFLRSRDEKLLVAPFEFGDIRSLMLTSMTLLSLQQNVNEIPRNVLGAVPQQIQEGVLYFWMWKNSNTFWDTSLLYAEILALFSQPFYGIGTYGRKYSRAWAVKTSYAGILDSLKPSEGGQDTENFPGYTDRIFGPPSTEEWLSCMKVQLPNVSADWRSKELSFVAVTSKNTIKVDDASPLLLLEIRSQNGDRVVELPNSEWINISIPIMTHGGNPNGTLGGDVFSDLIHRAEYKNGRSFTVYKITLPIEHDSWVLNIATEYNVSFKAMYFHSVPDWNRMSASRDLETKEVRVEDSSYSVYHAELLIKPRKGQKYIPKHFYVGVSVSYEGLTHAYDSTAIHCNCKTLGVFVAQRKLIYIRKLLLQSSLDFTTPKFIEYRHIVAVSILGLLIVLMFGVAFLMDRIAQKKEGIIYLDDNYPRELYLLVVGVFSGKGCSGGTTSNIAIRIIGDKASSKVHVLKSSERRTFKAGADDWFVMSMLNSPGKIMSIEIWQDYSDLSGWYCHRIDVYDINGEKHYTFAVEQWVDVSLSTVVPDTIEIEASSLPYGSFGTGSALNLPPHSFATNYAGELRNSHEIFSLFLMHSRFLSTYEHKARIISIKVFFTVFWLWLIQDIYYSQSGIRWDSVTTNEVVNFSGRLLLYKWAMFAALLSRPFTYVFELIHKLPHLSRVLQRKTTNPVYLETRLRGLATRRSSRRLRRKSSGSVHKAGRYHSGDSIRIGATGVSSHFSKGFRAGVKDYIRLLFGPCQFRCVDVISDMVAVKTRSTTIFLRCITALTLAGLYSFVIYVEFFTNIVNKTPACAFMLAVALVFDALILDPIIILIRSSIAFYLLRMTNQEKFLLTDEVKIYEPITKSYAEYLTIATREEYLPPSSSAKRVRQRKKLINILVEKASFYILALLALCCTWELLMDKYGHQHMNVLLTLRHAVTESHSVTGAASRSSHKVFDMKSAADYIVNTVAGFTGVWANGEPMFSSSRESPVTWTSDHFGTGLGAAAVLLLYTSNEGNHPIVPIEFEPYIREAWGSYTTSTPETSPLKIGQQQRNYTTLNQASLWGKTFESYPFTGHLITVNLHPWNLFYAKMRILMDDVMEKQKDHNCRAIIITANYVYPFSMSLATINILIELPPSGIAILNVWLKGMKSGHPSHERMMIFRLILTALFVCFTVYNFARIAKVGFKTYFTDFDDILKIIIWLANLSFVISFLKRFDLKYAAINELILSPLDEYSDLNPVYEYEQWDSGSLLFFFAALLAYVSLALPRFFGLLHLHGTYLSCVRLILIWILLKLYIVIILLDATQMFDSGFGLILTITHTNQLPPKLLNFTTLNDVVVYISAIILIIMAKCGTAIVVGKFVASRTESKDRLITKYLDILKSASPKPPLSLKTPPNNETMGLRKDLEKYENTSMAETSSRIEKKHRLFW